MKSFLVVLGISRGRDGKMFFRGIVGASIKHRWVRSGIS